MHILQAFAIIAIIFILAYIAINVAPEGMSRYRHTINDPIVGIFYNERPTSGI